MPSSALHSFSATNPCHVYEWALALRAAGALGQYYSGYPRWRLKPPDEFPVVARSWRTLITYGLQRVPERLRPNDSALFRWQDTGFDRAVARALKGTGFFHGIPGQCVETFRRAKEMGMIPVLNHASGPMEIQRRMMAPEYQRAGFDLAREAPVPEAYRVQLEEERRLATIHCAASSVVRDQLSEIGMDSEKIWVIGYGADASLFPKRSTTPDGPVKICFAGRRTLRKGIFYLLQALETVGKSDWELHVFGMESRETRGDFARYRGAARIVEHGAVSQSTLASELARMHLLVLPSAEEAFGLVVAQALSVGVPCVVSERVGAKDLIEKGRNGSVVPFGDAGALCEELKRWTENPVTVGDRPDWDQAAQKLIQLGTRFKG